MRWEWTGSMKIVSEKQGGARKSYSIFPIQRSGAPLGTMYIQLVIIDVNVGSHGSFLLPTRSRSTHSLTPVHFLNIPSCRMPPNHEGHWILHVKLTWYRLCMMMTSSPKMNRRDRMEWKMGREPDSQVHCRERYGKICTLVHIIFPHHTYPSMHSTQSLLVGGIWNEHKPTHSIIVQSYWEYTHQSHCPLLEIKNKNNISLPKMSKEILTWIWWRRLFFSQIFSPKRCDVEKFKTHRHDVKKWDTYEINKMKKMNSSESMKQAYKLC